MLKVLAVVCLIATSNSSFVNFSERALTLFRTANVPVSATPAAATLINSGRVVHFHVVDDILENDVTLELDELPSSAQRGGHRVCGNDLGIDIANFGTFCNSTYFHVKITPYVVEPKYVGAPYPDGGGDASEVIYDAEDDRNSRVTKRTMQFTVYFKSTTTPLCILDIPVFKLPPQRESANTNQLQRWAEENRVGLFSQTNIEKLKDTNKQKRLSLDFNWLSDLLKYGVFKKEVKYPGLTDADVVTFTSRPIVLSGENLEELKAWMGRLRQYYYTHRQQY